MALGTFTPVLPLRFGSMAVILPEVHQTELAKQHRFQSKSWLQIQPKYPILPPQFEPQKRQVKVAPLRR
jgi:hypothetical protein